MRMKHLGFWVFFVIIGINWVVLGFDQSDSDEYFDKTELSIFDSSAAAAPNNSLVVGLTLIQGAAAKGAGIFSLSLSLCNLHMYSHVWIRLL